MTNCSASVSFFDASALRICDSTPIKVTFLSAAGTGRHIVGFYTFDQGAFHDIRILFPNVDMKTLIPSVSSVFLGNRLSGKTPVFFVIENGSSLNGDFEWFADASVGKNGFWKFLMPSEHKEVFPALDRGVLVWKNADNETIEDAVEAIHGMAHPMLVWQSNNGKVFVVKGKVYHSFGYGIYPDLNPDINRHAILSLEHENASVVLNMSGASVENLMTKPDVSLRLQIGDRNFSALVCNRISGGINLDIPAEDIIDSVEIEIPEDFEDTLFIEGFEEQKTLPVAGTTFNIEANANKLLIKGKASAAVYEALLSLVKIRTRATEEAKSPVTVRLYTEKEEEVFRKGEVSILSENSFACSPFSGLPSLPIAASGEAEKSHNIFAEMFPKSTDETKDDDLPSFITAPFEKQAQATVSKPVSLGKTALIIGAASRVGKAVTYILASRGFNVVLHCHTAIAETTHLVEEIRQNYGVKASYIRADFSSLAETADLIDSVSKTYGTIDVLINNTSVFVADDISSASLGTWQSNMQINLQTPFVLSQAFALQMPKGKDGCIINLFDDRKMPDFSSYGLSCAALHSMMKMLAVSLAPYIRINGVDIGEFLLSERLSKADLERHNTELPLKTRTTPEEIAKVVIFLIETSTVTGQVLALDSGSHLVRTTEKRK